jgi:hypothetical protein
MGACAQNWLGALAQLGEHLLCKQGVIGSIPIGSTSSQNFSRDEDNSSAGSALRVGMVVFAGFARFFDIVNGFLIDAVAHGFDFRVEAMCYYRCVIWLRLSSALLLQVSSMGETGCRHASGKWFLFQACR